MYKPIQLVLLGFICFTWLAAETTQSLEFHITMNGKLEKIIVADSLGNEIHLDQYGKIIQLSKPTTGNIRFRYDITGHDQRQLFGGGVREYDYFHRLAQFGTMEIKYDIEHDELIDSIGDICFFYHWVGPYKGEIEYLNKIPIRKIHNTQQLDSIGDAIIYYRTQDNKIDNIRDHIGGETVCRFRLIITENDMFEE